MFLGQFVSNSLKNFLIPLHCYSCRDLLNLSEEFFCIRCFYDIFNQDEKFGFNNKELILKISPFADIDTCISFCNYSNKSKLKVLIYDLKYKGQKWIGIYFGNKFGMICNKINSNFFKTIDYIIPVPLSREKEKKRLYNQAKVFAEGISQITKVSVLDKCLIKNSDNFSQTKFKQRLEKFYNVKGKYSVYRPELIADKKILLVDDIITSGATIIENSNVLLNAGAKSVSVGTIGYLY